MEVPGAGSGACVGAAAAADLEPFEPERFDWPNAGGGPALPSPGDHRSRARAACSRATCSRLDGYRPLILERGREVKDRVADVRKFDAGGPVDPESNYLFGEGARDVQRRQAHQPKRRARRSPRARDPGRLPRQALDPV